jgi:hypothetical protein
MKRNHTLIASLKRVPQDLVFAGIMLGGMFVLFIFKPRYIKLVIKGYFRALRHGKEPLG